MGDGDGDGVYSGEEEMGRVSGVCIVDANDFWPVAQGHQERCTYILSFLSSFFFVFEGTGSVLR